MTSRLVSKLFGGIFDLDLKKKRLLEIQYELKNPAFWGNPERAQSLNRERFKLDTLIQRCKEIKQEINDAVELINLFVEEPSIDLRKELNNEVERLQKKKLER